MNKKMIIITIFLILISILLSGCLEEPKSIEESSNLLDNQSPVGLISASDIAYFGVTIEFDASQSYDPDGKIISYEWNFGDEETAEGKIVKHIYKFEDNFTVDYPLIFPIYLFLTDDDGSVTAISHQIKVFPKEYIFYLNFQKLTTEKPLPYEDKIRGSGFFKLRSPQMFTYDLENSITVQKCTWNVTLYLKKTLFAIANKISIIFYDNEGNVIAKKDEKLSLGLWREKTVKVKGTFDKEVEFKTLKIAVYGFSFGEKISIFYGGEKASHICFDFTVQ